MAATAKKATTTRLTKEKKAKKLSEEEMDTFLYLGEKLLLNCGEREFWYSMCDILVMHDSAVAGNENFSTFQRTVHKAITKTTTKETLSPFLLGFLSLHARAIANDCLLDSKASAKRKLA